MRPFTWCLVLATIPAALADDAAAFFDDSSVREIRIYFDDPAWYNTLLAAHRTPEDPYFPCRFQSGGVTIPRIGCRFKGNSSFQRNGIKKPFKLDFNRYDENATFLGLKKLNVNNFDLSPDFMREKLLHDLAGKYVTALRSVYVRLYVNDNFYGLYLAVEQPDKVMMQSRFGKDEDGNLYEGEEQMGAGRLPDLSWLGPDPAPYRPIYLLKTNETANDYSGLIRFIDILNNTPAAELPSRIEAIADVEDWLTWMGINNLVVNLDSYIGVAAEYYLYHRTRDGRFIHIQWDHNESFGITGDGTPRITTPATTDPFYLPAGAARPGGLPTSPSRPLLTKLWAVDAYKRLYLQTLARVLRESFNPPAMSARITQLADMIRPHVAADPNKAYTTAQFETNLNSTVGSIPGLRQFIDGRYTFLRNYLNSQTQPSDLRINELVTINSGATRDNAGDADPWVELYNLGPGPIDTRGYYLSDDPANPTKWPLPARTLADGEYLVVWLDNEPSEGDRHASFRLNENGGALHLFSPAAGASAIDTVAYSNLRAGQSFMRVGWFGTRWSVTAVPSAGAANTLVAAEETSTGTGRLKINEFMADNKTTLEDPAEPGAFEDWFEIHNPGPTEIDMAGMYLSDNPSNPAKYRVPSSVKVPAGGYVVFWADNDTGQGPTHTNFALDADREHILITDTDGVTLIDSISYSTQQEDVSFGRAADGADVWTIFKPATPGASNANPYASWVTNAASFRLGPLAPASIASAFGQGIASGVVAAQSNPLPVSLSGVTVSVADSANVTHAAPLYFVSPGQVNFLIRPEVAPGRAKIVLRKQDGGTLEGDLLIARVGPGMFSANATGEGVGLIAAVKVDAANGQSIVPVFSYDAAQQKIVPTPLSLGDATDRIYLTVYGTGFRGRTELARVNAQVGDIDIPVLFAGEQPEYVGLDQLNIGPLPRALAGKGSVEVELTVNGTRSNRVTITIQ